MGGKEIPSFSIKGPMHLESVNTGAGERSKRVGCSIIDLHFSQPSQFRELVFTNFYTACISIYVKRVGNKTGGSGSGPHLQRYATVDGSSPEKHLLVPSSSPQLDDISVNSSSIRSIRRVPSARQKNSMDVGDRPWECSLYMKHLMPCPHFESGSQDAFSIQAPESLVEWKEIVIMRIVMHQPSSVWKQFTLEDINVFRNLPNRRFSSEDIFNQKDNRLLILKANTKRMLSGLTVEPEPEKQENRK